MSAARAPSIAPPLGDGARQLLRWICTANPFYVISAGLFLVGLWISWGGRGGDVDNWALMTGLGSYTLLLAGAAFLLVRFACVWDDARTVLLLVVVLFLATSVTFDEVFALEPARGFIFYVVGLAFAVAVSESILRGIRLRLPSGFRLPYYLILGLFFLYPLTLAPWLARPHSEELMWGLFGFAPVAGLVFLTLLPAIRRGPDYVADNGSPWPWPLYPWSLFVMLALAVPARALLLCYSMHLVAGANLERLIFAPYFLVPFGFALAALLLEIGLELRRRGKTPEDKSVLEIALLAPIALVALAWVRRPDDPLYVEFSEVFTARLGADPFFMTLLAAAGFYAYAALRRVHYAADALALCVAALAFVERDTSLTGEPGSQPVFLLAAGLFEIVTGVWRRSSSRFMLGALGLVVAVHLALDLEEGFAPMQRAITFHLVCLLALAVGVFFDDSFAAALRALAALALFNAALIVVFAGEALAHPALLQVPAWALHVYPLAIALVLGVYGLLTRHQGPVIAGAFLLLAWLLVALWHGYLALRRIVAGLDYLSVGLALLGVALGVSFAKARKAARKSEAEG